MNSTIATLVILGICLVTIQCKDDECKKIEKHVKKCAKLDLECSPKAKKCEQQIRFFLEDCASQITSKQYSDYERERHAIEILCKELEGSTHSDYYYYHTGEDETPTTPGQHHHHHHHHHTHDDSGDSGSSGSSGSRETTDSSGSGEGHGSHTTDNWRKTTPNRAGVDVTPNNADYTADYYNSETTDYPWWTGTDFWDYTNDYNTRESTDYPWRTTASWDYTPGYEETTEYPWRTDYYPTEETNPTDYPWWYSTGSWERPTPTDYPTSQSDPWTWPQWESTTARPSGHYKELQISGGVSAYVDFNLRCKYLKKRSAHDPYLQLLLSTSLGRHLMC